MIAENNDIDKPVDDEIFGCINPLNLKSFFLFAGAGSGKTGTLVNVLKKFNKEYGEDFRLRNKKIAIITYTNAAADEINHRLDFDSIFAISTIHSFCWELIKNFTTDIKNWLSVDLNDSIVELDEKISKARDPSNKTAISNQRKRESKIKRLDSLCTISKFVYNPNGDNITKASLNHSEVIALASYFIASKDLFKQLLINKFPIVLIDESQDTKKDLIEALFALQVQNKTKFSLGLFGDTMQRIYSDGKEKLGEDLPEDWLKPVKSMNHRSELRIIELNNKIRKEIDGQIQLARVENTGGLVRFFIVPRDTNKLKNEESIKQKMSFLTNDNKWIDKSIAHTKSDITVKILTLEHHMAATRMGFDNFFNPLYSVDKLKSGMLEGSSSSINFFTNIILPLFLAQTSNNKFEIANITKRHSPLFDKKNIINESNQLKVMLLSKTNIDNLLKLWKNNTSPSLIEILKEIHKTKIISIPPDLRIALERSSLSGNDLDEEDDKVLLAWDSALKANFDEIIRYQEYISENSPFGTHQGVKGLEFERVMVIIDDVEARGNTFSYDKLFGTKALTKNDNDNISVGKETGIDKTSRLFYVACSRAKKSLAIVAYTDEPEILKEKLIELSWFEDEEIEILQPINE
ncbi:UvrD-helicase domain-containing protein [Chryseobacterium gambrini]|uniref:UvrD-helicase domain-containing protein n=1 Tax=Chryseobacterium gambrini TaxID=373672 RepID=UPI0022F3FCDC|nr:UvrD-helicase domain-containing protein [Chryseobacterium gambrini]WBX97017.1 AAA family ATPase [Chryseobacterium gambrini]